MDVAVDVKAQLKPLIGNKTAIAQKEAELKNLTKIREPLAMNLRLKTPWRLALKTTAGLGYTAIRSSVVTLQHPAKATPRYLKRCERTLKKYAAI
jgi:hypothetical protein